MILLCLPFQIDGLEALNLLQIFWIVYIVFKFLFAEVILPWKYPNPVWYFSILDNKKKKKTFYEEENGLRSLIRCAVIVRIGV